MTDTDGNDVFVHYQSIRGRGFRQLVEGQSVKYTPKKGERGVIAEDVEV
ncbi:MAG: cold shock domain-containing protein [Nitrososphaera sp.]|nr:cold shock domain-containing protein [Nitrososphaera sp.]